MKTELLQEGSGLVVPRVTLRGSKSSLQVNLILDTGAAYTLIGWEIAIRLGYHPDRQSKTIPVLTANGKIHVPVISLREVTIQDVRAKNVPAICHDIPEMIEVSGLLGLSFLRHFRTTIDFPSLRLSIE